MKTALIIIISLLLLLGGGYAILTPSMQSEGDISSKKVALPWNVDVFDDGSSKIFDIHLGSSTLKEAIALWGRPEKMALFSSKGKPVSVEVFFKNPPTSPMKASIVLTLAMTMQEMRDLESNTIGQSGTKSGDTRHIISEQDQEKLLDHAIANLTYIPDYKGLPADYFEERLGKPAATHRETETAISWFYPSLGLTLLIDDKGKDVFQYERPDNFQIPTAALPDSPAPDPQ